MSGIPTTRFYLDDGTGTFPTEITSYVRLNDGYSFTRGRGDTQSAPTAGTMSSTLDNKTRAFTPGSTVLRSPSVIALDTRIRVKEIVNGSTYNRYTGYVKSWAVGWPDGVENTGVVRINCSDAQARAERRVLRSVVEEEYLLDGPVGLFTFDEPAGATQAGDTSGQQQANLSQTGSGTAVVFGTDVGQRDGMTSATFSGGKYLSGSIAFGSAPSSASVGVVFSGTGTTQTLLSIYDGWNRTIHVGIDGSGRVIITNGTISSTTTAAFNDGQPHYLYVTFGSGTEAKVDGSDTATLGLGGTFLATITLEVGGSGFVGAAGLANFVGTMSQLVISTSIADTSARVVTYSSAALTGLAGESGVARITRIAGYAGLTVGSTDTSLTNIPAATIKGQAAWQAIQDVADAEMGVAYIDGSGNLVFHNRQRITMKTSPDLTLSASFVTFDAEPTTDDQDLLNYMETTASATGVTQVVRDTVSESGDATHPAHGRYSDSKEYLVSTDDEARDRASWLVKTRAQPSTAGRYGTLTVNLYGMTAAQQSSVVSALEPGCWLRVVNMPTQTPGGTTVDLAVEGIAPSQSGNNWTIQCNVVSKATLYPKVFILDSSLLDGPDLLGV